MWYSGEIVLKSYLPFKLEEDMLFVNKISVGIMEPYVELWPLEELPEDDNEFMSKAGAPVNIFIIDKDENILATEEQIGWWDEGEDVDVLRDVSLEDINLVLREHNGWLLIEMSDETEDPGPLMFEDKVILALDIEDDEDWDVTLDEQLEEE